VVIARVAAVVADVPDPELPLVTVADLGILRGVTEEHGRIVVTVTPTYSGCPAMREIVADIRSRLHDAGEDDVEVRVQLSPAWTTDWITTDGRRKLSEAGIAPPSGRAPARCPRCGSTDTRELSRFSGTACKALHRCASCREPFEYLKVL
jgi:ring-1,2-phenylacetyl-CoA epoxidase subunit PaaD